MRLLAVTLRHYRLHRDTTVEFDPLRTLIGGPNEAGKSTLMEAIHHALFLKARTGGEIQKAMLSRANPLPPEVELRFEAAGAVHHLHKRFGGPSKGSTVLRDETSGRSWQGDEAESHLAGLLGVDPQLGRNEISRQWAHLWIRQGESGEDPSAHATAQKDPLLARLQQQGGAVLMQSERDAQVAAAFQAEVERTFTRSPQQKARTDSPLGRAREDLTESEAALEVARAIALRLDQAVTDFETAETALAEIARVLPGFERELAGLEARQQQVGELRRLEEKQHLEAVDAARRHRELLESDQQVRTARTTLERRQAELAPKQAGLHQRQEAVTALRERLAAAESLSQEAAGRSRGARLDYERARAEAERLQQEERVGALRATASRIAAVRAELTPLAGELADLPKLGPAELKDLRELDSQSALATAALEAMSASIERLTGEAPLTVAGVPLEPGATRVLTDETELIFGDGRERLLLRPGGGTRLAEARQRVHDGRAALTRALDRLGIDSLASAQRIGERRQDLQARIASLSQALTALDAEAVEKERARAEFQLAALEAEAVRRREAAPEAPIPATAEEAATRMTAARQTLGETEQHEQQARAAHQSLTGAARKAVEELTADQLSLRQEQDQIAALTTRLQLLVEQRGEEAARLQQIAAAERTKSEAESRLAATRLGLAELKPEELQHDLERLKRIVARQQTERASAHEAIAAARALLANDGAADPRTALALAEARVDAARETLAVAERKARAVQRLQQLFAEEQRALSRRFTAPLAERISGYLQCLFGPGARAEVRLDEKGFSGLELIRPAGEAFAFPSLSGGTREQLAAAVRLAMTELLAANHDGCLPVVFDDAFAYADPLRVQALQRMLDLAARRGLQVIVLSCTPADYRALGARECHLPPV